DRYETRSRTKGVYVPSDERFSDSKKSDFKIHGLKSGVRGLIDYLTSLGKSPKRWESLKDVYAIYEQKVFSLQRKLLMPQVIE
ncbi:unnamed protein product, partial [Citrullus colocynthis]